MFIVTGANGQLGSQVVDSLLRQVPAEAVGVSVRDVGKAAELIARGVRVRAGDFTDPGGLEHAFEGAHRVLVISAAIRGPGAAQANRAALEAARAVGAEHLCYTSHQAASTASLFAPQIAHAVTEEHLTGLGTPFTALRNGFYAGALRLILGDAAETGTLRAPADGPVSWTAHADLAEVAALVLAGDDTGLDGVTAPLTAAEALDLQEVAAVLSELTGRTVRRVVVDDDEWKQDSLGRGVPEDAAEFTLGMYRAARRGEFAVTDPTLGRVIGRPPVPVRAVLEAIVSGR